MTTLRPRQVSGRLRAGGNGVRPIRLLVQADDSCFAITMLRRGINATLPDIDELVAAGVLLSRLGKVDAALMVAGARPSPRT